MSMPTWDQFMIPVLQVLDEGNLLSVRDIREQVAVASNLTQEQLADELPSGHPRANGRIGWAVSYLARVGAIERPSRGHYRITDLGRQLRVENPDGLTETTIRQHARPDDQWWKAKSAAPKTGESSESAPQESLDPIEQVEQGIAQINEDVAAELLERIQGQDPAFFERAVVRLLLAMGYGGSEGKATVTPISGDSGIDGIIDQDALGVNRIYIQAKRFAPDKPVGRPALQAFVGALSGKADSGVMITTSRFSPEAVEYAQAVPTRIIMIDGKRLTELMIRYRVGTQAINAYEVVEVDEDFFE